MSDVLNLTQALIACPSVTPDDAGCQTIIAEYLQQYGFTTETLRYDEVTNLWASHGQADPTLLFLGHTDVVPPGPRSAWLSDPFEPVIREGLLYGRGAADMKGSLAAMVVAAAQFVDQYPQHRGRVGLVITSDEEGPGVNGTRLVLAELHRRSISLDFTVVGEPSCPHTLGDTVKIGRRGSLHGQLTIQGKQGHIAYPQLADNPIHRALSGLQALVNETWDDGTPDFQPTQLQISNMRSGTGALNVIPGELQLAFNLRFSPASTPQQLQERIIAILQMHQLTYQLTWEIGAKPYYTPPGRLSESLVESIEEHLQCRPKLSTTGGTSDGRFAAKYQSEIVEFGPCNATIHQVNECVAVADLERLPAIYFGVLQRLLTTQG